MSNDSVASMVKFDIKLALNYIIFSSYMGNEDIFNVSTMFWSRGMEIWKLREKNSIYNSL